MFGSGRAARVAVVVLALLSACTRDPDRRVAPNLLSPAPDTTSGAECVFGMIRADLVHGREALEALGPYAPSWLPAGFGLAVGWRPSDDAGTFGGEAGAIWTDASCRQIHLDIFPGAAAEESPRPEGVWARGETGECTLGDLRDVPCLWYHAQASGDVLNLMTADLPEDVAQRIVDGIELPA